MHTGLVFVGFGLFARIRFSYASFCGVSPYGDTDVNGKRVSPLSERATRMKAYVHWAVCSLYLTVAPFCGAASFTPVPLNCNMLDSSPVTNPDKRIEVSASGFSVLPPQGEKLVRQIISLARAQFRESPGERSNFRTLPVAG